MPKDEFDFDDPMELRGLAFPTSEDTTDAMCECFIEEFMRLGYNPKQLLALFRNPHYTGMRLVWEGRGEAFVRQAIQEVFARWGRPVRWGASDRATPSCEPAVPPESGDAAPSGMLETASHLTDPMGGAVPTLNI